MQKYVHKKTYFKTAYKINYKEQSYSTLWCQCRCTCTLYTVQVLLV
jgi:hypothetical protein